MSDKAFVDTNVLAYAFDQSSPERQRRASELLRDLVDRDRAVTSAQVLKELFVVLTRKIRTPLSVDAAVQIVDDLTILHVVDDTMPLLRKALAIHSSHSLSLWDATIVATASAAACKTLYSERMNAGETIHGVTIQNPFA